MLSLHVYRRLLQRPIYLIRVLMCQASAAFIPDLHRLHCHISSCNIGTSCSLNARTDEDIFDAKSLKRTRSKASSPVASVFFAGAAKTRSAWNTEEDAPPMKVNTSPVLIPTEPLGSDGWSKLEKQSTYRGKFEDGVTDRMIYKGTDIKIAKSFLSFLAEKDGDISYRVLKSYLVLCVKQNQEAEVCDLYDIMKMKFQSLETGVKSLFIRGLIKTDRWRESLAILESMKKVEKISARNYADCIKAAIEHQEAALGLTLYDEAMQNNLLLPEDAIQCLFSASQDMQDDGYRKRLLDILRFFRQNQIYPTEVLMKSIKSWFESIPNESWKGKLTKITDSGHCQVCKQPIESIHLTPDEYSVLKEAVIDSIIKGEDTFRKTTPQELEEFLQFVKSKPPYDIVVDGLNVAYNSTTGVYSKALLNVVSCLTSKWKRILVLGRKHMLVPSKKWQKQDIQRLQEYADLFLIDNISLDDPFLLYACINSGNHCCFITRDLLRDHKACLPNVETQQLFFKWQRGHQLVMPLYTPGKVHLQPVLSYDTILQYSDTSYHIPYDKTDLTRASHEVPRSWLCLKKE
ncbi:mitochondrial ribonuclease P catalytic subunit [Mantella aurantiaca]